MNNLINVNNFCFNCCLKMLSMIKELPLDIRNLIFQYIRNSIKALLNKKFYFDYSKYYIVKYTDNYVRKIIRNDYYFLFENYLIKENIYEMYTIRRVYNYKNKRFKTYKDYLKNLCDLYEANKCRVLLQ